MPNKLVRRYAAQLRISESAVEEYWKAARVVADEKFKNRRDSAYWGYVNGTLKRMLGISKTTKPYKNRNKSVNSNGVTKELTAFTGLDRAKIETIIEKNLPFLMQTLDSSVSEVALDSIMKLQSGVSINSYEVRTIEKLTTLLIKFLIDIIPTFNLYKNPKQIALLYTQEMLKWKPLVPNKALQQVSIKLLCNHIVNWLILYSTIKEDLKWM
jgi:hypothetical protein